MADNPEMVRERKTITNTVSRKRPLRDDDFDNGMTNDEWLDKLHSEPMSASKWLIVIEILLKDLVEINLSEFFPPELGVKILSSRPDPDNVKMILVSCSVPQGKKKQFTAILDGRPITRKYYNCKPITTS